MIYPFLSKLRIPFFVITFVIIALDITLSLLGFYLDFSTTTPTAVIFLVLNVGFLIFYVVTFVRIMGRMKVSKELRGHERKFRRLSEVSYKYYINSFLSYLKWNDKENLSWHSSFKNTINRMILAYLNVLLFYMLTVHCRLIPKWFWTLLHDFVC
jgi:c-di-AMP phosphodiesterase-like protein